MKFYDTCSLLEVGEHIFDKEEKFVISNITFKELENIKTAANKDPDIKYSARELLRLFRDNTNKFDVMIHKREYESIIFSSGYEINDDARILSDAIEYKRLHNDNLIFVTNDLSLQHIATYLFNGTIESIEEEEEYLGYTDIKPSDEELNAFYSNPNSNIFNLNIGEYLILRNQENKVIDLRVWTGATYRYLNYQPFCSDWFGKVVPYEHDIYQQFYCDSLTNNKITMARGFAGSGKAQPNSTLIPTPNGWKPLGELTIGDKIFDRFGKLTTITAVYPQGIKDNYKVTFSDGRISYCNDEHLWSCYTSRGNLKTFTLREMMKKGFTYNSTKAGYRFKIPVNKPVEYQPIDYKIDPYVIGAFLGDGCCNETPLTISSSDEEIVKKIKTLIHAKSCEKSKNNYNWIFRFQESKGRGIYSRILTKEIFADVKDYLICGASDKQIPPIYKIGSIEQRKQLLQGLLDTDGTIDKEKGRIRFTSVSYNLIKDVQEICWSLGYLATISKDTRSNKYTNGICYNLSISCSRKEKIDLFSLSRKKNIAIQLEETLSTKEKNNDRIAITSAELIGQEEMTCILVDNEEHLYLTQDYIVTHNTYLALAYLMSEIQKNRLDKIIIFCNTVATADTARLG